jgi:hypothetical protein
MSKTPNPKFFRSLELGNLDLFGAWDLEFGIFVVGSIWK